MASIFDSDKENKNIILKNKILEYFIMNGNSTNNDLSKELNLSVPTISKVVNEMCLDGFINEYGKLETEEGRRPCLYGLNPDSGYFVGVDLMKSGMNIGLMNFRGDLVDLATSIPYHQENTPESLEQLCKLILTFIEKASIEKDKILNININISGRVNPDTGYSYSIFNFSESSLSSLISSKLGYSVSIENDSRAMAYGEYVMGCVKGEKNVLFVNLSEGLGMGIIIDGNLYKGKSGYAGEIGHIHTFDNDILCHCGKKGCLETEVSGSAFHRIVAERLKNGETSILKRDKNDQFTLEDLIAATIKEDPICLDVVEEIGRKLGETIAGLINIFNPELVIIGGTMSLSGDYIIHAVESAVMKYSLSLVNKDTKFRVSKLKDRAGVIGACMIARKNLLQL
ncbi:MAG: ROK family transcriptional regulator [Prevotella sp.]|jgi:predicted NBD/HSP70 family sugar kinase|nr:ROK family transcriptional regulator [Prevotella sp.]MCI1282040.1 ROK family transcriptional regulator [Prevotella sp.]